VIAPRPLSRRAPAGVFAALAAFVAPGCVSHSHPVGLGATGTAEQSARQFYLFFGLVPLNTVELVA
jgi:hypothetical protein